MTWKAMTLTGWGRSSTARVQACRPERQGELARAIAGEQSILAHGGGRSYGDAALNNGGRAVLTARLDRMLSFDPASGLLVAEPGVDFRAIKEAFLPRGFMAPASPGTAFATLGGAVAADVHGKNHDRDGSFGDHVEWLDLITADGETRRIGPDNDPALFRATIGGMGLTGLIARIAVRLLPSARPAVRVKERRLDDLDAFIAAIGEARASAHFSVGWIDALAGGRALGRGILQTAEFTDEAVREKTKRRAVPIELPFSVVGPLSVRAFNALYLRRVPRAGREIAMAFSTYLYPLDAIEKWNRIYGRRGFYQFQCVLPDGESPRGLREMLETIGKAGRASFLAVLKTLGRAGRGDLSFPMPGFTLALDFPRRPGAEELVGVLHRIALERGGRVYLAKDALLDPASFKAMYPRHGAFMETLARIDPKGRFSSDMARRLALKPA
jgi:decaprenylphospho-beta-D-ribofuranose 2-oxidase